MAAFPASHKLAAEPNRGLQRLVRAHAIAGGITAGKRHMIGPWRIDITGDQASSRSSYWVVNASDGTSIVATGGYTDELTKRHGVWKLQKRVQTIDPSFKL